MAEGLAATDASSGIDAILVLAATALALIILVVCCCLRRARHEQLLQGPASDAAQDVAIPDTQSPPAQVSALTVADILMSMTELQSLRIPTQRIKSRKFLARGAHCSVYSAQYDGAPVALKVLSLDVASPQQKTRALLHELLLCYRLQHPNVMRVLGVVWTEHHAKAPSDVAMVMELLAGGNLQHLLAADTEVHAWKWLSTKKAPVTKLSFAIGIIDALAYIHAQGILHGGLKAKNVLLTPTYSVKLSDLGVTRHTEVQLALRPPTNPSTNRTAGWIAPELFQSSSANSIASDIYAFGAVLCELDTGKPPFSTLVGPGGLDNVQIALLVVQGKMQPKFSDTCPDPILDLAATCMAHAPTARPSAHVVATELRRIQSALV